ncbi:MAG TPA: hypothetical protein VFO54_08785 [Chryseosolibacter sp.]|nr:hypothetical protein [Chryseosolibacter sp.]
MARAFLFFIGCCLMLGSCTQRSICPAFQSAYIHDKDELRKKFSYFQEEDSTPRMLTASKNKYLVAEATPYRKKLRSLQTVAMKPVPVHVPDSLVNEDSVSLADLDRAARSIIDSTFIPDAAAQEAAGPVEDSVYVISKDKELRLLKYNGADSLEYDSASGRYVSQKPEYYVKDVRLNIEQDNYMWYLRDHLVLPDVRLARLQQGGEKARASEAKKKKGKKDKKEKKGFFKNLFKKKKKETDSTDVPAPPKEEFDFIDADTLTQAAPPAKEPEAKKGFFSARKSKEPNEQAVTDPALIAPGDKKKKKAKTDGPDNPEAATEGNKPDGF